MDMREWIKGKTLYGLEGDALKGYVMGAKCQYPSVEVFDFEGDREALTRGLRLAGVTEVSFRGCN